MVVCLQLWCRQRASYHLQLLALLCQILRFLLCCYIWRLCSHKRYRTHFHLLCICSFSSCTEIFWCKSNTSQLCSALFCYALPQTRAFPQTFSLQMALCFLIHHWYHRLKFSPERVLSLIHLYPYWEQSIQLVRSDEQVRKLKTQNWLLRDKRLNVKFRIDDNLNSICLTELRFGHFHLAD